MAEKQDYGAGSIKVLEGLEGVRKRPAMYIGSTSKDGLHHMVYEVADNSVDEAMAGHCDKIIVTINKDGSVTVEDNGRGIPVETHEGYGIPACEVALTKLHAGGKFDDKSYAISGGLHGVGLSCVNALSEKLILKVKKHGKIHKQEYSRGLAITKLKVIGTCDKNDTGTSVTFFPDDQIFSTTKFDYKVLETRFRETAFLNAGLKIILIDEVQDKKKEFYAAGGLIEFVKWLNKSRDILHKPFYFKRETEGVVIEVAFQYTNSYQENIFGFVNTINTVEGGTHVSGFRTAITRVVNDYAKKKGTLKNESLMGNDVREGITAVVSVKVGDPQFEGQTKTKLGNSEVKGYVDSASTQALAEFFEENPSAAKRIIGKAMDSAKARLAAKRAKDLVRRKNVFSLGGLPGKLADCSNKKSDDTELYIVEGDSAAGTCKTGRDRKTQAILPLRGKILNVEKSNPARALSSEEITNLITAIGTGVAENFDIAKLRYKRIIIMTDADVDGDHIKTLLLTFFFRFMPELIENGNVYVALPPLFRVRKRKDYYVYSDEELNKLIKELNVTDGGVTRFKGLGEMDSTQLWDTTMNPKTRKIKKIFIEDMVEADSTFSMLMGDDVASRKAFISENAKEANLDI
ncbi:DNA topoisomerase (ATP-hydrolyzing) subunit B [Candidatus Pacearchaeota archaeon]|nr:DNA topoisomerase (ATP-hydrolyzing) subunit B [Candidatus Pacearchaeota archaeon]